MTHEEETESISAERLTAKVLMLQVTVLQGSILKTWLLEGHAGVYYFNIQLKAQQQLLTSGRQSW